MKHLKKYAQGFALGSSSLLASLPVLANVDTSPNGAIANAIAANTMAGTNVGTMVIGMVLTFAVIYIIIGMVKRK